MAEKLKRAAAWLGLVADDRYAEYDEGDNELTEGVAREDLLREEAQQRSRDQRSTDPRSTDPRSTDPQGTASSAASVTTLENRRPVASAPAPVVTHHAASAPQKADMSRIITVHPRTYNEARTIGEHFRDGVPVIMNLTEMEDVDAKRLVDFAAGLIFGLRGTIERITSKVFLLSPQNVTVAAEDKERIAGGFFNQS
ncbi:MAG: cell division protein SepF [Propionibacteriaceae bacterium]